MTDLIRAKTLWLLLICCPILLNAQDLSNIIRPEVIVKHPKVSFDGTQMVFMADYDGRSKPYISTNVNGQWSPPQLIFSNDINGLYFFSYPQLSFDNRRIYFSAKTFSTSWDIYYSDLINGSWSEPQPIWGEINSNLDEEAPAVSPNEKIILFTRPTAPEERSDEYCRVLYITELDETGQWSEPHKMSVEYNMGCEIAPYYSTDNKTFYFSSTNDVMDAEGKRVSRKIFNIYWAKIDGLYKFNPKVIPELMNPDEHQSAVSIDRNGLLYFGQGDIFKANDKKWYSAIGYKPVPSSFAPEPSTLLSGTISDTEGNFLNAEISIINPYTSKVLQKVQSNEEGYYQVFVPSNNQFSVVVRKESYSTQSKLINTDTPDLNANFSLFPEVNFRFNVFDSEFYFPLTSSVSIYDSTFQELRNYEISNDPNQNDRIQIPLGQKLFVIFNTENYHPDTLSLPFDKEVIFSEFDFDVELVRKLKNMEFLFTDDATGENLGLEVTVYNVTRNEKTVRQVKDGKLSLNLRDGEVYEISSSAQGYSYFSAQYDLTEEEIAQDKVIETKLKSIKNSSIVLNNITFEYNSFDLIAESYAELDKLVNYLMENEGYKVEIVAHTDDKGAESYNLQLSRLRAGSVMNYLQDHGILSDRLISKGYGESVPLFPNDSEENRAKNRRVEFKILNDE